MTPHPTLPGQLADGEPITDESASWEVADSVIVHDTPYAQVRTDTIVDTVGEQHPRLVVQPNGAVGVVALDADGRVLLVQQYRHPVGQRLLEIPAGTLDVAGEQPLHAAQRELAEEADVSAANWQLLGRALATPGYSSEAWDIFLADDLSAVPEGERMVREAEEADMQALWMPLDEAVAAVADGRITDAMTVIGLLRAQVLRAGT